MGSNNSSFLMKVYNVPDALSPEAPMDAGVFLNGTPANAHCLWRTKLRIADPRTRTALHAPTSKNWSASIGYAFGNSQCPLLVNHVPLLTAVQAMTQVIRESKFFISLPPLMKWYVDRCISSPSLPPTRPRKKSRSFFILVMMIVYSLIVVMNVSRYI